MIVGSGAQAHCCPLSLAPHLPIKRSNAHIQLEEVQQNVIVHSGSCVVSFMLVNGVESTIAFQMSDANRSILRASKMMKVCIDVNFFRD